ncbi:bifunctional alpha,alpha-trehalose-phosphate synthase (UDP-forming)/trehalose-phosphatase [Salegentibacter mishustinae]|uniref:Alpha,alpha-trehalose-phosphate synthase n=1 Tax=Salegentibacter mishustinae TaxID=270918 RepID=A0A0Q9ZAW9_9FLAO|nr:bifunctional alpha,alpha-trehalose-phosphate synthase (UDP-forming)/trehalose-phosphatase [Salegentibacter mishustinae]KRG30140.1 trehalose-6-phosphate synthase [Salegentibacter mishustinae]PNW19478.1 trehalose-6-phosphate synthase [Salegentibacter mishustinae]PZX62072.1 trehalose 6-phosphate synthase/phosphatase [Salegentibacter mishustinae]GGW94702.1 bifunctional alpha,alpha-trehalose-phosphate synthase (UDP-forming)/trehalose-phosphatase [Salegentibacter mishustinae]
MSKTIIISNRLPLQISLEDSNLEVTPSVGGLATGLKSFHKDGDSIWIGWSGLTEEEIPENLLDDVKEKARKEDCVAVNLSEEEIDGFYYGFSNRTIWPLFHYFMEYTEADKDHWETYKSVNRKYADEVLKHYEDGDHIWVHDYQLLLVPNMIREKQPEAIIGFFNHIPFPSYEVFRTLPWRDEVLEGVLGADLIGFHTYDYERHFLSSVSRILRHQVNFNEITLPERIVKVDSFPMGIDYNKFEAAAQNHFKNTEEQRTELQRRLDHHSNETPEAKLILSIDRLDYTKGIANRIRAFEYFLDNHPEFIEKVRLVMLAVPSRSNVPQYQRLKREIDELVGRINGKFSTVSWTPIWYFYRSMPFENLIDLYTSCDIALLTPIRDGMNLVAKEFVATRINQTGVLILSEMAGAAHEMNEALIINPNNFEQISQTLIQAIEMPIEEQQQRNKTLQKRLKRYSVEKWANDFMKALHNTSQDRDAFKATRISSKVSGEILEKFKNAKNRILFLDYDGTLVNFTDKPEKAKPDQELIDLVHKLNQSENTDVVLISGRDKDTLGSWWQEIPVELISEHGVWMRQKDSEWELSENVNNDWMSAVRPVIETFVDRTPGTFIEDKNYSLAWHYRKADPELGEIRANELSNVLKELISNRGLSVLEGNKVLEIKSSGVNKGKASNKKLVGKDYDFIFAIGDDWTDEYMFEELPEESFTVKVGMKKTSARYYIEDTSKVRDILKDFAENS